MNPDFANFAPDHSKDEMHRLVVEHGGSFSMNQIDAVTHMVADRKEGERQKKINNSRKQKILENTQPLLLNSCCQVLQVWRSGELGASVSMNQVDALTHITAVRKAGESYTPYATLAT
jgi:hypothetical protein